MWEAKTVDQILAAARVSIAGESVPVLAAAFAILIVLDIDKRQDAASHAIRSVVGQAQQAATLPQDLGGSRTFTCWACRSPIVVPPEEHGQIAGCPKCGKKQVSPQP
jgi:hypothetical protein